MIGLAEQINMAEFDDDIIDDDIGHENKSTLNKKKALVFLLPVLIVIGIAVGFYHNFGKDNESNISGNYTTVTKNGEDSGSGQTTIFYDLPEIRSQIKTDGKIKENVNIKITIELSSQEDIIVIESLLSKLNDIIIAHTSELTSNEISGTEGLYWLKEELLHRINLVTDPIRVENINFKSFEVQKAN